MAGYPHDPQLRARIQAFSLDEPGVVFPFSARLARENGWTHPFSARVVEEYRRFVYLAMTAGHPVTPSQQVDEAWHLHLMYTRSYWEEMCGRVLGRPLHHEPTKGGPAEGSKFVDWYARTLDSYRRAFGHAPPPDVWPPPAERFAAPARIHPARNATHWRIRKPRLSRRVLATTVAIGALLVFAACTGDPADVGVPGMLAGIVIIIATLAWMAERAAPGPVYSPRRRDSAGGGSSGGDGGAAMYGGGSGKNGHGDGDGNSGNDGGDGGGDGGGGDGGGGCGGGGCGGGCGGG